MRPDYRDIDEKILLCVTAGRTTFLAIQGEFATGVPFRTIDRRLQALRKRGALKYNRKTGWRVP